MWWLENTGLTSTGLDIQNSSISVDVIAKLNVILSTELNARARVETFNFDKIGLPQLNSAWSWARSWSSSDTLASINERINLLNWSGTSINPLELDYSYGRLTAALPQPIVLDSGPAQVDATPFGTLRVEGTSAPFITATFNVPAAIAGFFGVPPEVFQDRLNYDLGVAKLQLDYTTIAANLIGEVSLRQAFSFTPDPVRVVMVSSLGETIDGTLGDRFEFDAPEGEGSFTVTATYTVSGELRSEHSLVLTSRLQLLALDATLSANVQVDRFNLPLNLDLGPAYDGSIPIGGGAVIPILTDVYDYSETRTETYTVAYENFHTGTNAANNVTFTRRQDTMDGLGGNDRIVGNARDNTILGGAGSDSLVGGGGTDVLSGGDGNDTLDSGAGYANLAGGAGLDRLVVRGTGGVLAGGAEADTFVLASRATAQFGQSSFFFEDLSLEDRIDVSLLGIPDAESLQALLLGVGFTNYINVVTAGKFTAYYDQYGGGFLPLISGGRVIYTVQTTSRSLLGTGLAEDVFGAQGNDTLSGGGGDDRLFGGGAQDRVSGGLGNDTLLGGAGLDTLAGDDGDDDLRGGADADWLDGGAGYDKLSGGGGNDTLISGAGGGDLSGGDGADRLVATDIQSIYLTGGEGADTFVIAPVSLSGGYGPGIYDMTSSDWIDVAGLGIPDAESLLQLGAGLSSGLYLTLRSAGVETYFPMSFPDFNAELRGAIAGGRVIYDGRTAAQTLIGGSFGEDLLGAQGADSISGGGGNDGGFGGGGNDRLAGGEGNDTLLGGAGADILWGDADNDDLRGGEGNDLLFGGAGGDVLIGGDGNDTLDSGAGYDSLVGGLGADRLVARGNGGTLLGDQGADSFVIAPQSLSPLFDTNTYLRDFGAEDRLDLSLLGVVDAEGLRALMLRSGLADTFTVRLAGQQVTYWIGPEAAGGNNGSPAISGAIADGRVTYSTQAVARNLRGTEFGEDLFGSTAADTLAGGVGADGLQGGAGADRIAGEIGDDTLLGGTGNDTLLGGAGSDVLSGGAGDDVLRGGSGFDIAVFRGNAANYEVTVQGGDVIVRDRRAGSPDGTDRLIGVERIDFADSLRNAPTGSTFLADAYGGVLHVVGPSATVTVSLAAGPATVLRNGAAVTVAGSGAVSAVDLDGLASGRGSVTGSAAANSIFGSAQSDTLDGGGGNDTLLGNAGADSLIGNGGVDVASYRAASFGVIASLATGRGTSGDALGDWLQSVEVLEGSEFSDTLYGAAGADTLLGADGTDVLLGGAGNDSLHGGMSADRMAGGLGDDTYSVDAPGDQVQEAANQGRDLVRSSVDHGLADHVEDLHLIGLAGLAGTGNGLSNSILGTAGSDTLSGGSAGADTLAGGLGDDVYRVDRGGQWILEAANAGTDTIETRLTAYTLSGQAIERLVFFDDTGQGRAFRGTGNALANEIVGAAGNDTLSGGTAGADTLAGGFGNDVYIVDRVDVSVREQPGQGTDEIRTTLSAYTLGTPSVEVLRYVGAAGFAGTGAGNAETILGAAGNDTLLGLAGDDRLEGQAGSDRLNGGDGTDRLLGGADNDVLNGGAAFDYLLGGDGNDILNGGAGFDSVMGEAGNDVIVLGPEDIATGGAGLDRFVLANPFLEPGLNAWVNISIGDFSAGDVLDVSPLGIADLEAITALNFVPYDGYTQFTFRANGRSATLLMEGPAAGVLSAAELRFDVSTTGRTSVGGAQDDDLFGANGADSLTGGGGTDRLFGSGGNDTLLGGLGNDALWGGAGLDSIMGGDGEDSVFGGAGNDTLRGGTGRDTLVGGDGNDVLHGTAQGGFLSGGAGNDRFVLPDYEGASNWAELVIADYAQGDIIDLSLLGLSDYDSLRLWFGIVSRYQDGVGPISGYWNDAELFYSLYVPGVPQYDSLLRVPEQFLAFATDATGRVIQGTAGTDLIFGSLVTDALVGGADSDIIIAGAGGDFLAGEEGNDTLAGGAGNDTLDGGVGSDMAFYAGARADYEVREENQIVTVLDLRAGSPDGTDILFNIDRLHFADATVTLVDAVESLALVSGAVLSLYAVTSSGSFIVTLDETGAAAVRETTGSGRVLDLAVQGSNAGVQDVDASAVSGRTFDITGNGEANYLTGSDRDDTLSGSGGNDVLQGNRGNDSLDGGDGVDVAAFGGARRDYRVLNDGTSVTVTDLRSGSPEGDDTLSGIEFLRFSDGFVLTPGPISITANAVGAVLSVGGTTSETLQVELAAGGPSVQQGGQAVTIVGAADAVRDVDASAASAASVLLLGDASGNALRGSAGVDTLSGGGGDDTLRGDGGNDQIIGEGGHDVAVFSGNRGDYLISRVNGIVVADRREDGDGFDRLVGIEILRFADGDVAAGDTVSIEALADDGALIVQGVAGGVLAISLAGGSPAVTVGGSPLTIGGDAAGLTVVSAEGVSGGAASLLGGNAAEVLITGSLGDTVNAGAGADLVFAGLGNDSVVGGTGDDLLEGGGGADTLDGGSDVDTASYRTATAGVTVNLALSSANAGDAAGDVFVSIENVEGSEQDDLLVGSATANRLIGLAGADTLNGSGGNDVLIGGGGSDSLVGGNGTDVASYTGATSGVLVSLAAPLSNTGDAAGDSFGSIEGLEGSAYDDTLLGNAFANALDGSDGADTLAAGLGNDTLVGGAGPDRFVFDSTLSAGNVDLIEDFASGEDLIALSGAQFGAIAVGMLSESAFAESTSATTAAHRIIFDAATGVLSYDSDGVDGAVAIQFGRLQVGTVLTAADIAVVV